MNTANITDFAALLPHLRQHSRFASRLLAGDASLEQWLEAHYLPPCSGDEMQAWLDNMPTSNETELAVSLRKLRNKLMLKLMLRDLGGLCGLEEVMAAMTALAELTVQRALQSAMQTLQLQYGTPVGEESGTPQELLIIGMGKLGGGELNVSSDIDLIFVFPENGKTSGERSLDNSEFFTRVGRKVIQLINEATADGFVFRVDMRLRPYGDSGALVLSFAALEEYLITQGREWERYAWIKARVISPQKSPAISELTKLSRPFVFRKYMDFGAIESMRKLHTQIRQEVRRRDRMSNIKLGPGGIREIEFIAQVFQLIRGGRDIRLQIRPTLRVLQQLVQNGQLSAAAATELDAAYVFLRNLEHRLQYLDDQQTQELPDKEADQAIIASAMGYADYTALLQALNQHRNAVSGYFEHIFSNDEDQPSNHNEPSTLLWHESMQVDTLAEALQQLGYAEPAQMADRLLQIRNSSRYQQLPESSRQRLDKIMPQLIHACAGTHNAAQTLPRVLKLLEAISRRASYLAFLAEYPQVLPRLVAISSASERASDYLAQHPFLLDELLDAREIYQAPDWQELNRLLDLQLQDCRGDIERGMDVLRQFHHIQTFQLLAMDLQNLLTLEILSDHLSDLANLVLKHVLELCWTELRKKHCDTHQFAIIGYGKLGGRELGYESDLDLIFLYDDAHPDAAENYARLAQRINTVLSSYTSAGRLYETDLRLRPNGASGLLVSSIESFEDYQLHHAWTWEHQALTRARFSTGATTVGEKFEAIRKRVLCQQRDLGKLRQDVVEMRQKMHDGHPNKTSLFDIKHDSGGMVDIEFIVQYLVLAHATTHEELTANSGNLSLLGLSAKLGLIDSEQCNAVQEIYRTLRKIQHRMRLDSPGKCLVAQETVNVEAVIRLWNQVLNLEQ